MSIALLLISDGREEYLARCMASIEEMVPAAHVAHRIHVDDADHQLGFAGAIQEGWRRVLETDADYVLHVEQDFTFNGPVPLRAMRRTLRRNRHLVQIALLRQPWNDAERAAGGIHLLHPGDYRQRSSAEGDWLEHRRHFTTNPSLYPRWIAERGWPDGPESEGRFGIALFDGDASLRAAYWGRGEELVTHIGAERIGVGY